MIPNASQKPHVLENSGLVCVSCSTWSWKKEILIVFWKKKNSNFYIQKKTQNFLSKIFSSNFFFLKILFRKFFWFCSKIIFDEINLTSGAHCILVLFCMKLGHHKGTKVTEPDFWKKNFDIFCLYFCTQSFKVSEISDALQAQHYLTPSENRISRKNLVLAV